MLRVHTVVAEPSVSLEQPAGAPGSPTLSQCVVAADHGNVLHAAVQMMCVCVLLLPLLPQLLLLVLQPPSLPSCDAVVIATTSTVVDPAATSTTAR